MNIVTIPKRVIIFPREIAATCSIAEPWSPRTTSVNIKYTTRGISEPMIIDFRISFVSFCNTRLISGIELTPRNAKIVTPKGRNRNAGFEYERFESDILFMFIIPIIRVTIKMPAIP